MGLSTIPSNVLGHPMELSTIQSNPQGRSTESVVTRSGSREAQGSHRLFNKVAPTVHFLKILFGCLKFSIRSKFKLVPPRAKHRAATTTWLFPSAPVGRVSATSSEWRQVFISGRLAPRFGRSPPAGALRAPGGASRRLPRGATFLLEPSRWRPEGAQACPRVPQRVPKRMPGVPKGEPETLSFLHDGSRLPGHVDSNFPQSHQMS